jgi:hypothetical protein
MVGLRAGCMFPPRCKSGGRELAVLGSRAHWWVAAWLGPGSCSETQAWKDRRKAMHPHCRSQDAQSVKRCRRMLSQPGTLPGWASHSSAGPAGLPLGSFRPLANALAAIETWPSDDEKRGASGPVKRMRNLFGIPCQVRSRRKCLERRYCPFRTRSSARGVKLRLPLTFGGQPRQVALPTEPHLRLQAPTPASRRGTSLADQ